MLTTIQIVDGEHLLKKAVEEAAKYTVPYTICVTANNEEHRSLTLNILHGVAQGKYTIHGVAQATYTIHGVVQGKYTIHDITQGEYVLHNVTQGKYTLHDVALGKYSAQHGAREIDYMHVKLPDQTSKSFR